MDMNLIDNRKNLMDRYNEAVGTPGPLVSALQRHFIDGEMAAERVPQFVRQCEQMIEARNSLRRKSAK